MAPTFDSDGEFMRGRKFDGERNVLCALGIENISRWKCGIGCPACYRFIVIGALGGDDVATKGCLELAVDCSGHNLNSLGCSRVLGSSDLIPHHSAYALCPVCTRRICVMLREVVTSLL